MTRHSRVATSRTRQFAGSTCCSPDCMNDLQTELLSHCRHLRTCTTCGIWQATRRLWQFQRHAWHSCHSTWRLPAAQCCLAAKLRRQLCLHSTSILHAPARSRCCRSFQLTKCTCATVPTCCICGCCVKAPTVNMLECHYYP